MKYKYILLVLFVLIFVTSYSGCLEPEVTYETEYVNERFEVKNFEDWYEYGNRYITIDFVNKNGGIKSITNYYEHNYQNLSYERQIYISQIDSDKSYLVHTKIVTKLIDRTNACEYNYYTLYWGDNLKMQDTTSEYREGRYPTQQVSITHY